MSSFDVEAKRGTLEAARMMYSLFEHALYPLGFMCSIHGSTVEREVGRDLDFIVVSVEAKLELDKLLEALYGLGFELRIAERRGRMYGVVGMFCGFVVDITAL